MKVKPLFLVSVNTCTVTLCDTNDWWSDVSGIFLFFISFFGFNKVKNMLKLTEKQLGWHVNKIFKLWNCVKHWNDSRSVEMCGVWWSVTVNEFKTKKKQKKAQCTVHSGPNRNLTHFRGFHHKSRSSSNNHFLCSVFSYSEVLFFDSVVALHLYRYCLDPKEKRKKKIFSCVIFLSDNR